MLNIIIIGGFCFNEKPLQFIMALASSSTKIRFIDINQFPAAATLDDMGEYVINIINKDKELATNILVAYSMGGLIALNAALKNLNLITKIILLNSTPKFIESTNWLGIKKADLLDLQNKLEVGSIENFRKYFTALVVFPKRLRDETMYFSYYSETSVAQLKNLLQVIAVADFRANLDIVSKKLVLINATDDVLVKNNNLQLNSHYINNASHLDLNNFQDIIVQIIEAEERVYKFNTR